MIVGSEPGAVAPAMGALSHARVLIADDEVLLRQGLRWVVEQAGATVVAEVSSADELVTAARSTDVNLVISDIRMPPHMRDDGLEAVLQIRKVNPQIAVVVLSQHVRREYAQELLETTNGADRGGVGYALKQRIGETDAFVAMLAAVLAGETALDPEVVSAMAVRARAHGRDRLTPRQHEVMALIALGYSNARVAHELSLTERAVVKHIGRIYEALGLIEDDDVNRRVAAVNHYLTGLQ